MERRHVRDSGREGGVAEYPISASLLGQRPLGQEPQRNPSADAKWVIRGIGDETLGEAEEKEEERHHEGGPDGSGDDVKGPGELIKTKCR